MPDDVAVESDVDRMAHKFEDATADVPIMHDVAALPVSADRGDRLAGVLTLVRLAVKDADHGGDGGDALSGAVTLMRREVEATE